MFLFQFNQLLLREDDFEDNVKYLLYTECHLPVLYTQISHSVFLSFCL